MAAPLFGNDAAGVLENLRTENQQLRQRIKKYEFNLRQLSMVISGASRSESTTHADHELIVRTEESCRSAVTILVVYLNREVWPKVKFLPENWEVWDRAKGTLCKLVIDRLGNNIPAIWAHETFWHVYCVDSIKRTFRDRRASTTGVMKNTYFGEHNFMGLCLFIHRKLTINLMYKFQRDAGPGGLRGTIKWMA